MKFIGFFMYKPFVPPVIVGPQNIAMGDKQATLGRAKSLLRHQRGSQRRSYRFTLSNNRAPAMGRGT
jgi:hypothetical protein